MDLDLFTKLHNVEQDAVPKDDITLTAQTLALSFISAGYPPVEVKSHYLGISILWRGITWEADVNVLNDGRIVGYIYGQYQDATEFNFKEEDLVGEAVDVFSAALQEKMLADNALRVVEPLPEIEEEPLPIPPTDLPG